MKPAMGGPDWQILWGTPQGLFTVERKYLEIAFFFALLMHAAPFGLIWRKHAVDKTERVVTLQNVDLMEPESELPPPPPVEEFRKPKSALEFLKMALPVFTKPKPIPQIREIAAVPQIRQPKIAEPEKLVEKKMDLRAAPEIKLNAPRIETAPSIALRKQAPIKLEEVGSRAVAVPVQPPSIQLDRPGLSGKMAEISPVRLPPPVAAPPPSTEKLPLGYAPRGGFRLDQPREVARAAPKPVVESPIAAPKPSSKDADLNISREKVKITGPLSQRKVVKSSVPNYPGWARARNIEADVAIRFTVSPGGSVLDDMVVQRTSGHPELDKLALEALRKWQFTPLKDGRQVQWGVITFRYTLE